MGSGESVEPIRFRRTRTIFSQDRDLQYVKSYQPQASGVKHVRVLLYGPVGHGKSSFVNSVTTTLEKKVVNFAEANSSGLDQSFTKDYKTHRIQKESRQNFYPFVFNDIMGLEEGDKRGVSVDDIKLVMKGHVKENYKFNPVSPLSSGDPNYNKSPTKNDKVHVLVCVCSANESEINSSVLQKMKEIREAARDLGIPQMAVITKVDEACAETEKRLRNVYRSKYVKRKMTDFSRTVGIPLNCVFPVKNYSNEISTNSDADTLILSALRRMIDNGDGFIDRL